MTQTAPACLLLVGGSFNPPHIGHMRAAIEASELLRPRKTLFIPASSPPHKPDAAILPFDLRVEMLRKSIATLSPDLGFEICEVENERQGPSFTVDTLRILAERHPTDRLVFLLGAEDYSQLSAWYRWNEIPVHADLAVIPRKNYGADSFRENTLSYWPGAKALSPGEYLVPSAIGMSDSLVTREPAGYVLPNQAKCLFLALPQLEISSSLVRQRFLAGLSLDFLVPPAIQAMLQENAENITGLWS